MKDQNETSLKKENSQDNSGKNPIVQNEKKVDVKKKSEAKVSKKQEAPKQIRSQQSQSKNFQNFFGRTVFQRFAIHRLEKLKNSDLKPLRKKIETSSFYQKSINEFEKLKNDPETIMAQNLFVYLEYIHGNKMSSSDVENFIDYIVLGFISNHAIPFLSGFIFATTKKYSLLTGNFTSKKGFRHKKWKFNKNGVIILNQFSDVVKSKLELGANILLGEHIIFSLNNEKIVLTLSSQLMQIMR